MNRLCRTLPYFILLLTALLSGGCQGSPVPHLTADVIMLEQEMSKKEVKAYLGEPDFRQEISGGQRWIYYHVNKSLLRKTPLIGRFLGSATVETVSVDFRQNRVIDFQYQTMAPETFKEKGYRRNG